MNKFRIEYTDQDLNHDMHVVIFALNEDHARNQFNKLIDNCKINKVVNIDEDY